MSRTGVACRLFVTDLDGTVLVDEGARGSSFPARTARALSALHASGVTVILASGRMHESMRVVASSLDFKGPIISCNGAMIKGSQDELLDHTPLDSAVSDEVVAWAEEKGVPLNFYHGGKIYSRRFHPWWDLYEGKTCSPMQEVKSLMPYQGKAATKLLLQAEGPAIRAYEAEFKERFGGRATVMVTADEYLEFMAPQVDKGRALERLAAGLGVGREAVVAAGDGYNDVGMLRWAGTGLAISNGRQAAKDEADHVVGPPHEGGVADFIERHLL